MIFSLLNVHVIGDVGQMAWFGRLPSLQLLQTTVCIVAGDLQFRQEFRQAKMCARELVAQRTVPTLHRVVGARAVVLVMVPQKDFLWRQPRPLEVLVEAVDKVGNSQIVDNGTSSEQPVIGGADKMHWKKRQAYHSANALSHSTIFGGIEWWSSLVNWLQSCK